MKQRVVVISIILLVIVCVTVIVAVAQSNQWQGQKWEYAELIIGGENGPIVIMKDSDEANQIREAMLSSKEITPYALFGVERLDIMGADGWEFVAMNRVEAEGKTGSLYIFKRPRQ